MMAEASAAPEGQTAPPKKRKSGIVVPHAPTWYQRLGARLVFIFLRSVAATLRYEWNDRSGYFQGQPAGPAIYCVWHNRLALCMTAYFGYVKARTRTPGMAAIVSASKDGGFLAGILTCFKVQPVRGSSSRRGPQALLELRSWADRAGRAMSCRKVQCPWRKSLGCPSCPFHIIWVGKSG